MKGAQLNVGFIGAGAMGRPMALNLTKGGHKLVVYDRQDAALAPLVAAGARAAASPAEVVQSSEIVFTSLPSLEAVESVFLGENGLVPNARPGQVLVDLSTILPSLAQRINVQARGARVEMLDAPVSGGTHGAKNATLSVMVGGEKSAFERVKRLLQLIGQNIYYVGLSGSGSRVKLINQLLVAVHNVAAVEALALAGRCGVDIDTMRTIISASAGDSRTFQSTALRLRERDFDDGASIDILDKDSQLVQSLAEELGAFVPMLLIARKMYQTGKECGLGAKDMASLVQLFERSQAVESLG
ncbi:MAG TPA: NAD(P)-dependent oxidoreductase [Chloroflexota bacterium]|nr:NAD(P)-dependent oxidoreductase [Chloroflexota bacterium]